MPPAIAVVPLLRARSSTLQTHRSVSFHTLGDFFLGGGVNRGAGKGGKEGAIRRALFVLSGVLGRILTCPETTEEPFFSPQLHIIFFSEVALLSTSLLPRFKQINKIKPRTTF